MNIKNCLVFETIFQKVRENLVIFDRDCINKRSLSDEDLNKVQLEKMNAHKII